MPASRMSCDKSPPVYPCVSCPIWSRSTSSPSCMWRALILRISERPFSSGCTISISREKRPKRRSAPSMLLGLFVAATTMMFLSAVMPSMSVSICETMRFSISPLAFSRFPAITSTSSIQMMEGWFFSASSKHRRRCPSDSPDFPDITSGPLMRKKKAPLSLASAWPIMVLPHPGGPYSSTPRGGFTPTLVKSSGCLSGSSTISRSCPICLERPPMSS
mmetsp:Transcript_26041/g.62131  ORF Transcript_26041/g.62131 Transcript_26041/m.62131 type:complete len:218 (-) Transcript_26041:823-1476(-)